MSERVKRIPRRALCSAIGVAVGAIAVSGAAACGSSEPRRPPVCPAARTVIAYSQCGPTLDFTPINQYHGALADAQVREDAVVLIDGSCTGTLIAAGAGPVVLTAGHCVGLGDRPLLAFNVEANPDGDPLVTSGTVIEQALAPDYALIRLDQLPAATPIPLTTQSTDRLAIIQHPRGGPKVIAEGDFFAECHGEISYTDLDTLAGSSGAGVLNMRGFLYGVHSDGDCDTNGGGTNSGFSAASIVAASAYLQDADIADR
jgi:Trypsin-like peptidase domain